MTLRIIFKVIGRFVLSIFILGILFVFYTVGRFFIPGAVYITHPLHMAVQHNVVPLVYVLSFTPLKNQRMMHLKGGCDTPLQTALKLGSVTNTRILLDRGAGFADCGRNTVLHFATGHPELLEYLIEDRGLDPMLVADADKDIKLSGFITLSAGYEGEYPVFSALRCLDMEKGEITPQTNVRSLEIFLEHGVDPNIKTRSGHYENLFGGPAPLLAVAAINNTCSLAVKKLLEVGANPIEAEESLKNYFYKLRMHTPNAQYTTGMDEDMSDVLKENIRLVKRAASAAIGTSD